MKKKVRGFVFRSDFDSGNLKDVVLCNSNTKERTFEFELYFAEGHGGSWVNFSVEGHEEGDLMIFHFKDMKKRSNVIYCGHRPVVQVLGTEREDRLEHFDPNFSIGEAGGSGSFLTEFLKIAAGDLSLGKTRLGQLESDISSTVGLRKPSKKKRRRVYNVFKYEFLSSEKHQISFSYPFEYQRIKEDSLLLEQRYLNHPSICVRRDLLCLSEENRRIEYMTITNTNTLKRSKKRYIVFFSRMHPGEVTSSFVLEGITEFLTTSTDFRSHHLRENFVFLIFPCLDPDGVVEGHYRSNHNFKNINRHFYKPFKEDQPIVNKCLIRFIEDLGSSLYYIFDLHSHQNRLGSFLYGEDSLENNVFAKIMEVNSQFFSASNCKFYDSGESLRENKSTTARHFFGDQCKVGSFTFECNFNTVDVLNPFHEIEDEDYGLLRIRRYEEKKKVVFGPEIWRHMGFSILLSVLDYHFFEANSASKIRISRYKNLEMLRQEMEEIDRIRKGSIRKRNRTER